MSAPLLGPEARAHRSRRALRRAIARGLVLEGGALAFWFWLHGSLAPGVGLIAFFAGLIELGAGPLARRSPRRRALVGLAVALVVLAGLVGAFFESAYATRVLQKQSLDEGLQGVLDAITLLDRQPPESSKPLGVQLLETMLVASAAAGSAVFLRLGLAPRPRRKRPRGQTLGARDRKNLRAWLAFTSGLALVVGTTIATVLVLADGARQPIFAAPLAVVLALVDLVFVGALGLAFAGAAGVVDSLSDRIARRLGAA